MTLFDFFSVLRIAAAGAMLLLISVKDLRSRRLPGRLILLLAAFSLLRLGPGLAALPGPGPAVFLPEFSGSS